MVKTIVVNPVYLAIVLSIIMGLSTLVLYILFRAVIAKYSVRSGDAVEPYIGGEHPSILSRPFVAQSNLYWGFVKRNFVKAYGFLKGEMHTGRLSDWIKYMSSWLGLLLLIALVVIIALIIGGW